MGKAGYLGLICLLLLLAVGYFYFQLYGVRITRYEVPISGLPDNFDNFTILHITDLHSKRFGTDQSRLMRMLSAEKFDMLALTGDLVDADKADLDPAIELITGLSQFPSFRVDGNHEQALGKKALVLQDYGTVNLSGSYQLIQRGEDQICLIGLDYATVRYNRAAAAIAKAPAAYTRIVLSHSPAAIYAASEQGVDLVLAGHTHGGQVRLPGIGAIITPDQGFFPVYSYGTYRLGDTQLVINGGMGESIFPLRFCNRVEAVLITLKAVP